MKLINLKRAIEKLEDLPGMMTVPLFMGPIT